jgi:hypothetical protein
VAKDSVEAYAWFTLAAGTYEPAAKDCDAVPNAMSPEQIVAGNERSKELRAMIDAGVETGGK